tara:strand:+ start:601 stop:996 length:396 start_codon:yes stop_codon:yes gene_type:complete
MKLSPKKLGDKIKFAGMTKTTVAERAGTSPTMISKYLKGEHNPRPHRLADLAKALRVSVADLCDLPADDDFSTVERLVLETLESLSDERAGKIIATEIKRLAAQFVDHDNPLCETLCDLLAAGAKAQAKHH